MKPKFCIFFVIILLGFCVTESLSCTCVLDDLGKRFKKANAVFIGRVYDYDDDEIPKIQNYKKGSAVLLVKKTWKGIKKELVAVDFEFPEKMGACPQLYRFEDDADYLIFAYGKDLKVQVQCSDTQKLKPEFNWTTREILKLNSSWFRFWANINLF